MSKLEEAKEILKELGFPKGQQNDNSTKLSGSINSFYCKWFLIPSASRVILRCQAGRQCNGKVNS